MFFSSDFCWLLAKALKETLLMTLVATFLASLIGFLGGVLLTLAKPGHLMPTPWLYRVLDLIFNIGRSLPFIILMVAIIPLTRMIVGTSIGTTAAMVPLTLGAIPLVARLVEGVLQEIPSGLLEASQAMGASIKEVVWYILLPEALPGLINTITITLITVINYSAMAGTIGGGGLGDIAIRYGYQRFDLKVMLVTVILLILLVQLIQMVGDFLVRKVDHR